MTSNYCAMCNIIIAITSALYIYGFALYLVIIIIIIIIMHIVTEWPECLIGIYIS